MAHWFRQLRALVTTHVPFPRAQAFFGALLLAFYGLAMVFQHPLAALGLHPAVLAFVGAFTVSLWYRTPAVLGGQDPDVAWPVLAAMLVVLTGILFVPSLVWLQHGYSLFLAGLIAIFVGLYNVEGPTGFVWFAQHWRCGHGNAANWHVCHHAALLVCNEAILRHATATEWIISIAILPILMHYLTYWTIMATHPYEEDPEA